ncbi:acyl carrier protein [Proteus myxofaciens ATCC 19692]|uniref:Acyl carrier protein n=1 Tax=Proteus myxofaciens ATCC 19692 TaxID=1354337 RepID=A0A198EPL8_9GAMM|nr:acyl carrier protein [Proteus myxofaciens ATCC 19692]
MDATEILVFLNDEFNIQVTEGDDPSYMRTINNLVTFILDRQKKNKEKMDKETH